MITEIPGGLRSTVNLAEQFPRNSFTVEDNSHATERRTQERLARNRMVQPRLNAASEKISVSRPGLGVSDSTIGSHRGITVSTGGAERYEVGPRAEA